MKTLLVIFLLNISFCLNKTNAQTWSSQNSGTLNSLSGIYFIDANTGWVVGSTGTIVKTTNGGTSWTYQNLGFTGLYSAVHFISSTTGWIAGEAGTVLKTTNGGTNWFSQNTGYTYFLFGVHFPSATTGWVVGERGYIWKTTNGGTDWIGQNSGTGTLLWGVYFSSSTTGWAIGNSGVIIKTTNGGTTWSSQNSGTTNDILGLSFVDSNIGYAVGVGGTVLKTTNGGTNWTSQNSGTTNILESVSFINSTIGWAVGNNGRIITTTNGGTTWSSQNSSSTDYLNGVFFVNSTTGWAIGGGTSIGTILKYSPNSISTSSISPLSYCQVGSVSIPYSISGTYNSGNIFTAQLSDSSGSFANPISIETVNSTTAGTINAIIPLSTSAGTRYRIRVISSNPAITGSDNGVNITVNVLPPLYSVTGGGSYCQGGSGVTVGLSDSRSGVSYQLKRDGVNTGLAVSGTGASISFGNQTLVGSYSVVATNTTTNCAHTMWGSVSVSINPLPTQYVITGGGSYCTGGSGLNVGLSNSQSGVSYQLQVNGANSGSPLNGTGSSLSFGTQTTAGAYTVIARNTTTNCIQTMTGSTNITISSPPLQFAMTGGGNFCEGDAGVKVGLQSSESNVNYQLKLNGNNIGSPRTGTGSAIDFGYQLQAGTYNVEAMNSITNCVATMADYKDVVKNTIPTKPTISKSGNDLTSSAISGNQWYFNSAIITGATSKVYTATKSGKFSVKQIQSGCSSPMSDLLDVVIDADKLVAGFNANPTTGDAPLNVSFTDASTGKAPTSWAWDFGDAGTSTQQNPTHNYTKSGSYTVKLTVSNGISNDTKSKTAFIVVSDAPNVTADLKGVPTTGDAPLSVQFTDMSTGSPTAWDWDFGDATSTSSNQNPSHTYNTAGTYSVKLTVTKNSKQFSVTKKDYIVVSNPIDIKSNFSATPTVGNAPLNVQFTDLSTGSPTDWFWDFGDGFTNATQNPNHTFSTPGNYSVKLIIAKGTKKDTTTKTNYITVNSSAPLKADLVADVTIGETPLTVQFTDKSTGKPTTWSWDFGDAGTSKEQNPSHTYSKAGVYTVGLTVSDGKTIESTSKSAYITVKDVLPLKAEFSGTPLTGEIPLTVQFTDQSTGKPTIYSWEFGDGGKSSEKNPSYTYTKSGKYTVKLTVSDGKTIETNTKPDYINPTDPLPLASEFKADVTNGTAPLTVKFTDLSTGHPRIWSWDFGDGQTDNTQNPSHVYSTNGTYSVKLSVSDGSAIKTQTKNSYITVGGSSGNGEGTISIKDATGNTGEIITIPIYLTDIKNITDETTGFTATLYCNATILHPEGSTPLGIVNDSLVRIIDLSMPAKPDVNGIIYNLKFLVMLGNDIGTYILIDNIAPVGKNILVNSVTYSKFLIGNIKTEGGVRLVVNKNKMIKLTQCDPNPASDKINLTVETNISDIISLDLYNLFGDKVLNVFSGQLNEGQTEYKIDLNEIPTGSYYILLKHSDGMLSRMVQVIK